MAFIDGSATSQITFSLKGAGSELMTSASTSLLAFSGAGNLGKVTTVKRAKATSSTRIRVDFTAPVDNNQALVTPANWALYSFNDNEFQSPVVHAVEVPSSAGATTKYVILIVSEMHQGTTYALTINSDTLAFGPELISDGDMEAPNMDAWTPFGTNNYVAKIAAWPGNGTQAMGVGTGQNGSGFAPATGGSLARERQYALQAKFYFGDGVLPVISNSTVPHLEWKDKINVTATGTNLTKTGGAVGAWDAGATSDPIILGTNVALEFMTSENNRTKAIGFSHTDPAGGIVGIDFAVILGFNTVTVEQNGVFLTTIPGGYVAGSIWRMTLMAGTVQLWRDGALLYTFPASPVYPLRAVVSMFSISATVTNVYLAGPDTLEPFWAPPVDPQLPPAVVAPGDGAGNRVMFITPKTDGFIQFTYNDPANGGDECAWDDLSLRLVYGGGDSSAALITSLGFPVAKDVVFFSGMGVFPKVKVAIATTAIDVVITFTEPVAGDTLVLNPNTFTFNNGLTVIDVEEIGPDFIHLRTSEQTPGTLYQLTIDHCTIADQSGNLFATPTIVAMIGFIQGDPAPVVQALDMYYFLLAGIRDEDQNNGGQFVQRLLVGPQQVWEATTRQALAIPQLWNLEVTPDIVLQYVKDIVGWTKKYDPITMKLTNDALRRLISVSVPFWKQRGTDDIIEDILRMITGTRVRVLDWFWYRWILGETQLGEDHDGIDPWLLSTPGEGPDAQTYVVRVVDDGTLDYDLINAVLRLTRPCGERVEVDYVNFQDDFPVDGAKDQWTDVSGLSDVSGRHLTLGDAGIDEETIATPSYTQSQSVDWSNYTVTFRIKGTGDYYMDVYRTDVGGGQVNCYRIWVSISGGSITIDDTSGGGTLDAFYPTEALQPNVHYTIRVVVTPLLPDSNVNDIKVYFEADMIMHDIDGANTQGTIGIGHAAGGTVSLSEVEMFFNPMKTDFIDINT